MIQRLLVMATSFFMALGMMHYLNCLSLSKVRWEFVTSQVVVVATRGIVSGTG